MDKKTLEALKKFLAAHDAPKKATLGDRLDKGLALATKAVALVAMITTLLADVVTKLLPALETLLGGCPRPGPVTDPGRAGVGPRLRQALDPRAPFRGARPLGRKPGDTSRCRPIRRRTCLQTSSCQ